MTCANATRHRDRYIYVPQNRARLVYWSTAAVRAVLKTKGDHTTIYGIGFSSILSNTG